MGLEHVETIVANDQASVDFTGVFDDSADRYVIYCDNVVVQNTNARLQVRFSSDEGITWDSGASDYAWSQHRVTDSGATSSDGSAGDNAVIMPRDQIAYDTDIGTWSFVVGISDPFDGTRATLLRYQDYGYRENSSSNTGFGGGQRLAQSAIGSIRFVEDGGGNISSGIFSVYKVTEGAESGKQHIETIEASNQASVDFTNVFASDDGFDRYEIHADNIISATDSVQFNARLSSDGGSTWDSGVSDYANSRFYVDENGQTAATGSAGTDVLANFANQLGSDTLNNDTSMLKIIISDPTNPNKATVCHGESSNYISLSANAFRTEYSGGIRLTQSAIDSIQFFMSSGNIVSGTFSVYGIGQ